jgi:hypothetical protein
MKKALRLSASTLVLMLAFSVSSHGWSDTGHMVVASVAYQNLTPLARSRVDRLIRLNPRFNIWLGMIPSETSPARKRLMLFMIAATWADQIKGDNLHQADGPEGGNRPPTDGTAALNIGYSDLAMHKYWHYIDLPFSTDGTPLRNPDVPNAKTQIAAFRLVLASNSPDALKSYDLVWLLHLVGDVHQPLHCAARFTKSLPKGDDGGNGVIVCDPQCGRRLHAFWDGLLGTSSDLKNAITVGQNLPKANAVLANNLNIEEWIEESFKLAQTNVYREPTIGPGSGPFLLTSSYRNAAKRLAAERVALAGARLAKILNSDLR